MAKIDTAKISNFVTHDVWHVKLDKFPKWQREHLESHRRELEE